MDIRSRWSRPGVSKFWPEVLAEHPCIWAAASKQPFWPVDMASFHTAKGQQSSVNNNRQQIITTESRNGAKMIPVNQFKRIWEEAEENLQDAVRHSKDWVHLLICFDKEAQKPVTNTKRHRLESSTIRSISVADEKWQIIQVKSHNAGLVAGNVVGLKWPLESIKARYVVWPT